MSDALNALRRLEAGIKDLARGQSGADHGAGQSGG